MTPGHALRPCGTGRRARRGVGPPQVGLPLGHHSAGLNWCSVPAAAAAWARDPAAAFGAAADIERICRRSRPSCRFIGSDARTPPARLTSAEDSRSCFVVFRAKSPCSSCRGRRRDATDGPRRPKKFVQIRPELPCSIYRDHHHDQRRSMRHHRHVHRCHRPHPARRCRAHRRFVVARRRRRPTSSSIPQDRGTSRIGPAPSREVGVGKDAGRGRDPARRRDPDCWGRLQLILSRLIGGRR
jgi:hypothetical protein